MRTLKVGIPKVVTQDAYTKTGKMLDALKLPEDVTSISYNIRTGNGYWKVTVEKL